MKTREFSISTDHEGMYNITARLREVIRESGVQSGPCRGVLPAYDRRYHHQRKR